MYRQMFISLKDSDDDSVSDFLAAVKANMLECNKKMGESESCEPLKEYLERSRDVHSKMHSNLLTGCLLLKQKILIGNLGLTFCDMLSYLSVFVHA